MLKKSKINSWQMRNLKQLIQQTEITLSESQQSYACNISKQVLVCPLTLEIVESPK